MSEIRLEHLDMEGQVEYLLMEVAMLTARLDQMEKTRKGGRPAKAIQVQAEGVCGLNPEIDSDKCELASLYRRRQGCLGINCMQASADYYKGIRKNIAEIAVVPE